MSKMNKITTKTLKEVIKLLKNYGREVNFSPQEYIDNLILNNANKICDNVAKLFLVVKKNERILECIAENYSMEYKIDSNDMALVKIIIYLIIFEIADVNYEEIKEIFKTLKISMSINLLKFFNSEEFLILTAEASCSVYDNDYVLNSIINPLLARTSLIEELQHELIENIAEKTKTVVKPPTKPVSPKLTKAKPQHIRSKTVVEQVENKTTFKKREIPSTTYHEDNTIKKKIQEARENNRIASLNLLQKANRYASKCSTKPSKSTTNTTQQNTEIVRSDTTIKPNKIPRFKPVDIKNNTTTIMRQAALFVKAQEKELKRLEALTTGAFDDTIFEEWNDEERKKIQQETIQNIEKKHLQGLMTREEALLAKQNLLQANKLKTQEFKAEKELLYKNLEEWKKEQQEKIRQIVEKTQSIDRAVKESEKKVLEEKYHNARMVSLESKKLLEDSMAEKQAELNRKIELIKEIKALQSVKELYRKDFDPTESPNLGLMCEMSIAELQERLGLVKTELKYEVEAKRKTINESRQQRKELLHSVQKFIEFNRNEKKNVKKMIKCEVKLKETEEIAAMKERLCELRKKRMTCL